MDTQTDKPTAPQTRRARPLRRTLISLALALSALLAATGLLLHWTLRTPSGTAWLLAHAPGVQGVQVQGALLDDFSARSLTLSLPGTAQVLELNGLRWQDLTLAYSPRAGQWLVLRIGKLSADSVKFNPPASTGPSAAPANLWLPLEIDLPQLQVGEILIKSMSDKPLRALDASVHLGARNGAVHALTLRSLQWDQLRLSGTIEQASQAPLTLDAKLQIRSLPGTPDPGWQAWLKISGPLAKPALQAALSARQQSLQASATLQPFEAWPLAALQASTTGLNLAALNSDWPLTAISGEAHIKATAWDQPALLRVQARNAEAGRWDQQRLPLLAIALDLEARPNQTRSLNVRALDVQFGVQGMPAGRLRGEGGGQLDDWRLNTRISDVQTALLDQRLTALRLNGKLDLLGHGGLQAPVIDVLGQLSGQWLNKPVSTGNATAQLKIDARYTPQQILLRQISLSAGPAAASAQAQLTRQPNAAWRVKGKLRLSDFDPRVWWSGPAGSAWQRSAQRFNAALDADLLSRAAPAWPLGQATLRLSNSVLMGVPVTGELDLNAGGGAASSTALSARLALAGNELKLGMQAGPDALQHWTAKLQAPDLGKLAPLLTLLPERPGKPALPTLAGKLDGDFKALGRWPAMTLEAKLKAEDLQTNWSGSPTSLRRAELTAKLGTQAQDDLMLDLDAQDLTLQGGHVSRLKAQGSGRWQAHRIDLELASSLKPPIWLNALLPDGSRGDPNKAGASLARLTLQGGLSTAPADIFAQAASKSAVIAWAGQLQQFDLRSQAALSTTDKAAQAAWISVSNVALDLQLGRDGQLLQAEAAAGRAELAGAGLRWSQLRWRASRSAGETDEFDLQAEFEPLTVSPLLARLQPGFGWSGDLVLGGHANVHMGAGVDVDIELTRRQGDLVVTDDGGPQSLGLSDLRLALTAQQGVWHLTQGIAGSRLGVLGGAITSRTSPRARWPAHDAPLEGVLEAQVTDLGAWGRWVPAGWRLGGALRAGISLGGRVGAPEIRGEANGEHLSVRNLLQGVDVREGSFAMRLDGPTAKLERFTAQAGAGTLQLDGSATFGESPQALLNLQANQFKLLGRIDRRIVTSGKAQLALKANAIKLDGNFVVDEGLIDFTRTDAPTLDEDVVVLRAEPAATEPVAQGLQRDRVVDINLAVDLGSQLRLRGRGLDSTLRGQLHLSQQGGKPALQGVVRTEKGTFNAYGQKLDIERGELSFSGAAENPRLDVVAIRPDIDIRVGVIVSGYASNPRVRLFSEPELSDTDKLSWLVLGRGPDSLGRADTALLQRAALALLSGEGEGGSDKLLRNIGLDEISIKQTEGAVPETIVRLGKQLSNRWYVGYERGLNATSGNWQLVYRVAQRFTLRAQSGLDNSLDLIWQWKWD